MDEEPAADQLYYKIHDRNIVYGDRDGEKDGDRSRDDTYKDKSKNPLVTCKLLIYSVAIEVAVFFEQKILNSVCIIVSFVRSGRLVLKSTMKLLSMERSRKGAETERKD